MKQILLIFTFLLVQIGSFSQNYGGSLTWDNNSVVDEKSQPELKIFPNPCKDKKVTIELNSDVISEIRLTNIAGQEVFVRKTDIPVNRVHLELVNIPNGIYMVQVKSPESKIMVKKLLVAGN